MTQMRILSGSSQDSSLPRLFGVEHGVNVELRKVAFEAGDGVAEVVIVDAEVGVKVEVASVPKLTGDIGDISGRGMNMKGYVTLFCERCSALGIGKAMSCGWCTSWCTSDDICAYPNDEGRVLGVFPRCDCDGMRDHCVADVCAWEGP